MALDYEVPEDKRSLYWLGDQLIEWRNPVMVLVLLITALFAYWTFELRLVTDGGEFQRSQVCRGSPQQLSSSQPATSSR